MANILDLIRKKLGFQAPQNQLTSRVNPQIQARVQQQIQDPRKEFWRGVREAKLPNLSAVSRTAGRAVNLFRDQEAEKNLSQEFQNRLGLKGRNADLLANVTANFGAMGSVKSKAGKAVSNLADNFVVPKEANLGAKLKRILTSGEAELKGMGSAGRELADSLLNQRKVADQAKGKYEVLLQDALQGLKKNERIAVGKVQEGLLQTSDPRIAQASEKLKAILGDIGAKAQRSGLQVQTPAGKSVPFTPRENYFPRKYDFDALAKGKQREQAIRHLVESGQAQNVADADRLLENFVKQNTSRKAGNLEYARTLDLPGYEPDPLKAVGSYIDSATRRLTEVEQFGLKDNAAKSLIDRVRQEGGDSRYAQEVFDLMTGQKKYKNPAVDLATKFNYITKLDLGFITNATQPVNTATKFGVVNTLRGILEAYGTPKKAGRFARLAGAIDDPITTGKAEGLSMGRVMETVLAPFSFVERKNRVISAVAGREASKQLAQKLLSNPENKLAIRQLRSLGIDPEKILAQGGLRAEDILGGAYEAARKTQFKVDAVDIPPGWKTNVGRLLSQFRSFSFKQSQFVRDEVLKEAFVHGNFTPLIRLVALAVPASFVAQSVRNKLTGRDPSTDAGGIDVRKWDKYLKVFGTIPTDLASQGKFLYDTYNNEYATPLKKITRTASTLLGPTVGETGNIATALESAGSISKTNSLYNQDKDPYLEMKRLTSGYAPFVGEYTKNKLFAYPQAYAPGSQQAAKELNSQISLAKKGKAVGATPIVAQADGRFAYRLGQDRKYADSYEEAVLALAKDKFKSSGKASEVFGDLVFRRDKDGSVSVKPKLDYDYAINTNKMQRAKTSGNLKVWGELAGQQLEILRKQYADPSLDELEKLDLEERAMKLMADVAKYKTYGGFKKPKKAKKLKKPARPRQLGLGKSSIAAPSVGKIKLKGVSTNVGRIKRLTLRKPTRRG